MRAESGTYRLPGSTRGEEQVIEADEIKLDPSLEQSSNGHPETREMRLGR